MTVLKNPEIVPNENTKAYENHHDQGALRESSGVYKSVNEQRSKQCNADIDGFRKPHAKKKVIIGLSGGVDSSVAAYLLLQQGYTVEGMFMKNWEWDDTETYCSAEQDLTDASKVAEILGIPIHVSNFSKQYWDHVFQHFLDEYQAGRTPNPDILCNKEIKFKAFLETALAHKADYIATGHYAKVIHTETLSYLCKARDTLKDQTYFLTMISQNALSKTLFPLGDYLKLDVRRIANECQFPNYNKKDSTGLCFIGERRFKPFLNEFLLAKPGPIHNTNGDTLGQHDGLMFYTLGQRQGLNIGGQKNSLEAPWYVVDKDIPTNTLIVAQGNAHPRLYSQGLYCGPIHWIAEAKTEFPISCYAKIRYRQTEEPCLIGPMENGRYPILFSRPQRAITPGQYIVFYENEYCLGGSVIEEIIR